MVVLVDDVLLKVFELLDGKSLKEASLVCRRQTHFCNFQQIHIFFLFSWNEIISLSPKTMCKFTLTLCPRSQVQGDIYWMNKFDEIKSVRRRFQSLCVELKWQNCQKEIQELIKISRCHGSQLKSFSLSSACFFKPKDFCGILENLPMLEELQLYYTRFELNNDGFNVSETITMLNLKTIKLDNSSWTFLKYFKSPRLKSIEVLYGNNSDRLYLLEFLRNLQNLESIALDGSALDAIFKLKMLENVQFQLKRLRILSKFSYETSTKVDRNFYNFLESQTKLEEIIFGSES